MKATELSRRNSLVDEVKFSEAGELERTSRQRLSALGWTFLHATAAMVDERLVAFLGFSGSGKSTSCRELARTGCAVSDEPLFVRNENEHIDTLVLGRPLRIVEGQGTEKVEKRVLETERVLKGCHPLSMVVICTRGTHEGTLCLEKLSELEAFRFIIENMLRYIGGGAEYSGLRRMGWELAQALVDELPVLQIIGNKRADGGHRLRASLLSEFAGSQ